MARGSGAPGAGSHVAIDADAKDVLTVEVTTEHWTDSDVVAEWIEHMDDPIGPVRADGAYDTHGVYAAARERGTEVTIPPRENAVSWTPDHPRTQALAAIAAQGLPAWKQTVGYHRRSIAENAMDWFKQLFGGHLASRLFETQVTEVHVRVAALNVMTYLGMPVGMPVSVPRRARRVMLS